MKYENICWIYWLSYSSVRHHSPHLHSDGVIAILQESGLTAQLQVEVGCVGSEAKVLTCEWKRTELKNKTKKAK